MKSTLFPTVALAAALFAGCTADKSNKSEMSSKSADKSESASTMSEAKVSKEAAQKAALARVPGGTIKEGELEKEHGKLIWSFDIAQPDSKDIKEVQVDAISGNVIGVDTETPADQAKEAAEDAKK